MATDKVIVLGGSKKPGTIGAQSMLYQLRGKNILGDIGMGIDRDLETGLDRSHLPNLNLLKEKRIKIDAVLATHSHGDHIAALPVLQKEDLLAPDAQIIMSEEAWQVTDEVLYDSCGRHGHFGIFDWAKIGNRVRRVKPGKFELFPGFEAYMVRNGHLTGSVAYNLPLSNGGYGLLMGDWCQHDQLTVPGAQFTNWPADIPVPRVILSTDFTYSGKEDLERASYAEQAKKLVDLVKKGRRQNKKIVIQGFANEKLINVALILARAGIPCYLDSPLATKIYSILAKVAHSEGFDYPSLGPGGMVMPVNVREGQRQELINSTESWVVLSTSGVGDIGSILDYYQAGLNSCNYIFITTNYLFRSSPAYFIKKVVDRFSSYRGSGGQRRVTFKDREGNVYQDIPIRAQVHHVGLSSHSTLSDSIFVFQQLTERLGDKFDLIICNHGTPESLSEAQVAVGDFAKEGRVEIAKPDDEIIIDEIETAA